MTDEITERLDRIEAKLDELLKKPAPSGGGGRKRGEGKGDKMVKFTGATFADRSGNGGLCLYIGQDKYWMPESSVEFDEAHATVMIPQWLIDDRKEKGKYLFPEPAPSQEQDGDDEEPLPEAAPGPEHHPADKDCPF